MIPYLQYEIKMWFFQGQFSLENGNLSTTVPKRDWSVIGDRLQRSKTSLLESKKTVLIRKPGKPTQYKYKHIFLES